MSTNTGGVTFAGLLFIAFLVLKLTGVIAWSWLWVTAPLWGGFALALVFITGAFLYLVVRSDK